MIIGGDRQRGQGNQGSNIPMLMIVDHVCCFLADRERATAAQVGIKRQPSAARGMAAI
jgi:hypothetical protein